VTAAWPPPAGVPPDGAPEFDPDLVDGDGLDALTEALARCYAHLARREHSVAELRAKLVRAGVRNDVAEEALAVVIEQGYLSDERYARLLAEDRRTLDGWGVERIRDRMVRAGIDRSLIDITLAPFDEASERQAAMALLRRRVPTEPGDARERQRAFALLVRQGFESDVAYDAIRGYGGGGDDEEIELAS
jgi:regulatory protein